MEIDPADFLAFVRADFNPEVRLHLLGKESPGQVRYLKRDLLSKPPAADYSPDELGQMAEGLEELRILDMDSARAEAVEILRTMRQRPGSVDPHDECEAWGIVGTIQRDRGRYSSAAYCLGRALQIPGARRVSTLQRVAYLLSDLGEFDSASRVLDVAAMTVAQRRNWPDLGRLLVSQGALYGRTGDLREAIRSYKTSLSLLPSSLWYGRFAASHGLGLAYATLGETEEALEHLGDALQETEGSSALVQWGALWLRAEILLRTGRLQAARQDLTVAREILLSKSMSPLDIALVSIRLVHVLFLQEEPDELYELATQMLSMLEPIQQQNALLAGTYAHFPRLAIRGELTADLIDSVYRKMHQGSQQAPPLLASIR